jgi:regulator of replication initiation timing
MTNELPINKPVDVNDIKFLLGELLLEITVLRAENKKLKEAIEQLSAPLQKKQVATKENK